MKRVLLCFLVILSPRAGSAQQFGDNLLIIKNDTLTLKQISAVLSGYGFTLERFDTVSATLRTKPKALSRNLKIRIFVGYYEPATFYFQGSLNLPQLGAHYQIIEYRGKRQGLETQAWDLLFEITKKFQTKINSFKEISEFHH